MKKLVTMQDISCVGKCSSTVALPVLSSLQVDTTLLPTAILSSHTAFQHVAMLDCTPQLHAFMKAWKDESFTFDAFYTAYMANKEQISIAIELLETFGIDKLKIIDPCMADHGKLYRGFDDNFVKEMKKYCKYADILTPNLTEACLLLDIPYLDSYTEQDITHICEQLCQLGCKQCVITGISFSNHRIGAYAYDDRTKQSHYYDTEQLPQNFHGTGDLWASAFTGALLNDLSLEDSMALACDFVHSCIQYSIAHTNESYGIQFESSLPMLWNTLSRYQS